MAVFLIGLRKIGYGVPMLRKEVDEPVCECRGSPAVSAKRRLAIKLMLDAIMDAFVYAEVPRQHLPSLETIKGPVLTKVLQAVHELGL